jgi:hypothetical protein
MLNCTIKFILISEHAYLCEVNLNKGTELNRQILLGHWHRVCPELSKLVLHLVISVTLEICFTQLEVCGMHMQYIAHVFYFQ